MYKSLGKTFLKRFLFSYFVGVQIELLQQYPVCFSSYFSGTRGPMSYDDVNRLSCDLRASGKTVQKKVCN